MRVDYRVKLNVGLSWDLEFQLSREDASSDTLRFVCAVDSPFPLL